MLWRHIQRNTNDYVHLYVCMHKSLLCLKNFYKFVLIIELKNLLWQQIEQISKITTKKKRRLYIYIIENNNYCSLNISSLFENSNICTLYTLDSNRWTIFFLTKYDMLLIIGFKNTFVTIKMYSDAFQVANNRN